MTKKPSGISTVDGLPTSITGASSEMTTGWDSVPGLSLYGIDLPDGAPTICGVKSGLVKLRE